MILIDNVKAKVEKTKIIIGIENDGLVGVFGTAKGKHCRQLSGPSSCNPPSVCSRELPFFD